MYIQQIRQPPIPVQDGRQTLPSRDLGILENVEMLIFQDFCQHAGTKKEEKTKMVGRELTQLSLCTKLQTECQICFPMKKTKEAGGM